MRQPGPVSNRGPLVDSMPLARALLSDPDVVMLDEAFGALDPDSMNDVASVIDEFAPTLIVIAHP